MAPKKETRPKQTCKLLWSTFAFDLFVYLLISMAFKDFVFCVFNSIRYQNRERKRRRNTIIVCLSCAQVNRLIVDTIININIVIGRRSCTKRIEYNKYYFHSSLDSMVAFFSLSIAARALEHTLNIHDTFAVSGFSLFTFFFCRSLGAYPHFVQFLFFFVAHSLSVQLSCCCLFRQHFFFDSLSELPICICVRLCMSIFHFGTEREQFFFVFFVFSFVHLFDVDRFIWCWRAHVST